MMSLPVGSGLSWRALLSAVNQRRHHPLVPAAAPPDRAGNGVRLSDRKCSSSLLFMSPPLSSSSAFFIHRRSHVLPDDSLNAVGRSPPIPVPTQWQNFQRLEQNLHCSRPDTSQRSVSTETGHTSRRSVSEPGLFVVRPLSPMRRCRSGNLVAGVPQSPPRGPGGFYATRRLSLGGARTVHPPSQSRKGSRIQSAGGTQLLIPCSLCYPTAPERLTLQPRGLGTRLHSAPCLLECTAPGARQKLRKQHSDPVATLSSGAMTVCPLHSSPRLSELMQRSPLPTILGSPSRVGVVPHPNFFHSIRDPSRSVLIRRSPFRLFHHSSFPNPPVLQTW